jgi:hypothetical protein
LPKARLSTSPSRPPRLQFNFQKSTSSNEFKTYHEWLEVTKLLPPDDGGYDIVKALDENRRWSGERPLLPNEVKRP